MSEEIVEVVAALIWEENKFLICQRPANKARPLMWEFVGGKVESGETKEQALVRECKEELDITLQTFGEFFSVIHEYPDITVRLTLFNAVVKLGEPRLLEHNGLCWIDIDQAHKYEFCPADVELIDKIRKAPDLEQRRKSCTLVRRIYKTLAMDEEKLNSLFSPTERKMVEFHFGLTTGGPETIEETAAHFNTNVDRIKQIEAKFMRKANRLWDAN